MRVEDRVIADALADDLEAERSAVAKAQAGDPQALEPVLVRHAEMLFSQVILPRVGERALAEDVLRDTFVTAIEKIGRYEWQGRSLFFWLRQVALNKVIDHHRARGRSRRFLDALKVEIESAPPAGAADEALIAEEDRRRALERIEQAM